jgi:hypothetical protein
MKQQAKGNEQVYGVFIDDNPYKSNQRRIMGAQLRELAHIEPQFRIFLEMHREENEKNCHAPDREIHNAYSIDLAEPGEEKFYTLLRPSMDIN